MKKKHTFFTLFLSLSLFSLFTSSFFCIAAYIKTLEEKGLAFGTIGLRSYFHCGSGSEDDPYVITRPKHLYNLSRLQALGIFSEKKYFQLGYDLKNDGSLGFYKGDDSSEFATDYTVLDMSDYNGEKANKTLTNIGNEATPFYGIFEGNGLTIKNATVDCSLEDSGLFGYVASKGEVRNFFLDNISVKNDGYNTTEYLFDEVNSIYSSNADSTLKANSKFLIDQGNKDQGGREAVFAYKNNENIIESDTNNEAYNQTKTLSFEININRKEENKNQVDHLPVFSFNAPSNYKNTTFSLLPSDDFFTLNPDGSYTLKGTSTDRTDIFSFFKEYTSKEDSSITYPLRLSMSMSLVANYLETSGLNHSKVVNALNISFELLTKNSTYITMYVQPRETQHGNNMGLVIGHCDGSCKNVFVHDGSLKMNSNKEKVSVAQNSMTGFIGLIGPSVHDAQSSESKGNIASQGKDVGVLDFTEIYQSIVGENTFAETSLSDHPCYSYTPVEDNDYMDFLRYQTNDGSKKYYTLNQDMVGLIGQKLIKDDDTHNRGLGVFSIATDYREGGTESSVLANGTSAAIVKAKNTKDASGTSTYIKDDASNIFYSTYEYNKENNHLNSFEDVKNTLLNYTKPDTNGFTNYAFYNGSSIPLNSSVSNQKIYEAYYNYLFRFKLDSSRSDFYFSDLNPSTLGGKFLSDYFRYKLTDEFGDSLELSDSQFGIMVKDKKRRNISELTTNFLLDSPDSGKMYILDPENKTNFSVANSINFEIKTDNANVTILASNREGQTTNGENGTDTGSMLGIYKLDGAEAKKQDQNLYTPYKNNEEMFYSDPDYGMALVPTSSISYFQYQKGTTFGEIGIKGLESTQFAELDKTNNKSLTINDDTKNTISTNSSKIKAPIFAHTFKLKKGRYCLGSALGKANVYYICAQGQDEGDLSLTGNIYSSINKVENVDFVKSLKNASTYFNRGKSDQTSVNLETISQIRCFLILDSGNISHFRASSKNNTNQFELIMKYVDASGSDSERFRFDISNVSYLTSIESITLTNYGSTDPNSSKANILVDFFYSNDNSLGLLTDAKSVRFSS